MAIFSHLGTRKTIWNSDYVIYVTEEYLQSKYPTKGISEAISDAVIENLDPATLDRRISSIRSRFDGKSLNLMSIGAIDVRYKGHEEVIKAIPALQNEGFDVSYYLIGAGSDTYLRTIAQRSGVESKVHFVGGLPHEQIFEKFENIDIYIQPSRTEGLPRSVVEAMSCAVPVICSRIGGMPELVAEECIYTSGNISELVDCIRRMVNSSETLEKHAKLNFQSAYRFRKDHLAAKRENFLKNVIMKNEL
jgi:glycosyltransferase involved in cell wall biosynthesis